MFGLLRTQFKVYYLGLKGIRVLSVGLRTRPGSEIKVVNSKFDLIPFSALNVKVKIRCLRHWLEFGSSYRHQFLCYVTHLLLKIVIKFVLILSTHGGRAV